MRNASSKTRGHAPRPSSLQDPVHKYEPGPSLTRYPSQQKRLLVLRCSAMVCAARRCCALSSPARPKHIRLPRPETEFYYRDAPQQRLILGESVTAAVEGRAGDCLIISFNRTFFSSTNKIHKNNNKNTNDDTAPGKRRQMHFGHVGLGAPLNKVPKDPTWLEATLSGVPAPSASLRDHPPAIREVLPHLCRFKLIRRLESQSPQPKAVNCDGKADSSCRKDSALGQLKLSHMLSQRAREELQLQGFFKFLWACQRVW